MVGVPVATVAAEKVGITCSCVVHFQVAAVARLKWGQHARYSRCHSNNVGLPSEDLTRASDHDGIQKVRFQYKQMLVR